MEASPLGPSRKVKAAVRKSAKALNTLPADGLKRLERLFHSKYGVDPESIVFSNSLTELLYVICRRLRPKKVLIIGPALNIYQRAAESTGAVINAVSGGEEAFFSPDLQNLIIKAEASDLVFIANPNRITGKAISQAALRQVLAALSLKVAVIVIDEALIEFSEDEGYIRAAAGSSSIIVIRTTSCYYGLPGLELAYAAAGQKLIESLRPALQSAVSVPAIEAARAAVRDRSYRRLSAQYIYEEKKNLLRDIRKIKGIVPFDSDTNIILLKAPGMAAVIAEQAGRSGLAAQLCGDIDGLDDSYLRISVMRHEHNLKLRRLIHDAGQNR